MLTRSGGVSLTQGEIIFMRVTCRRLPSVISQTNLDRHSLSTPDETSQMADHCLL